MLPNEFNQWIDDYFAMFPQAQKWLREVSAVGRENDPEATEAAMVRTLEGWRKTLKYTPLLYAARVTDQMVSGQLDPVDAREREQTALIVRRFAAQMIARDRERRLAEKRQQEREKAFRSDRRYKHTAREVFTAYLDMLETGDPNALSKMRAMADEPPEGDEEGHRVADGFDNLF